MDQPSIGNASARPLIWGLILVTLWVWPGSEALPQQGSRIQSIQNLTAGFRLDGHFTTMANDPHNPLAAYIGTDNGYIYRTEDGGASWSEIQLEYALLPIPQGIRFGQTPLQLDASPFSTAVAWPQGNSRVFVASDAYRAYAPFTGAGFGGFGISDTGILDSSKLSTGLLATRSAGALNNGLRGGGSGSSLFSAPVDFAHDATLLPHGKLLFRSQRFRRSLGADEEIIQINWLAVDPTDSKTVLAATTQGLYESNDAGISWVRVFDARDRGRRHINHVMISRTDGRRFMCTNRGLIISEDRGVTHRPSEDVFAARFGCKWTEQDPTNPQRIWRGAGFGATYSENYGDAFKGFFLRRIPGQRIIKQIAFSPFNPDHMLLMADEAIFVSTDRGKSTYASGLLTFPGQQLVSVRFGQVPGQIFAATVQDLWQSNDMGQSWQVVVYGKVDWKLRMLLGDPLGGGMLVLSKGEVLRLLDRPMNPYEQRKVLELEKRIYNEPSLSETLTAALKTNMAWRADLNDQRDKASASHLVPIVQMQFHHFAQQGELFAGDINLDPGFSVNAANADLPQQTRGGLSHTYFLVLLSWDLPQAVHDRDELPQGRIFQDNEYRARRLREVVINLYTERRRLQLEKAIDDNPDARRRTLRRLRMEELTLQLNVLTGGLFEGAEGMRRPTPGAMK